jgi:hypothetical protein
MIRVPIKDKSANNDVTGDSSKRSVVAKVERALLKSERFLTVYDPHIARSKFDDVKIARLHTILKELGSEFTEQKQGEILEVARRAWFELDAVTNNTNIEDQKIFRAKKEEDLLRGVADAAKNLRAKWDEVDSHPLLAYSLELLLSAKMHELPKRVKLPNDPDWWREQFDQLDRKYFDEHYEKIVYAMTHGLIQIVDAATHMADDISKAKLARNSEQYRFVLYLASAWKEITGRAPTITGNIDARKHRGNTNERGKASLFERFATEAACDIKIRPDIFKSVAMFQRDKTKS